MKALICLLLLGALTLVAADLSGKWHGNLAGTTSDGEARSDELQLDLKVDGHNVSGTLSVNPDHPFTIRNGRLDDGKLTFEVLMEDPVAFNLVYDGNRIRGNAVGTFKGGEKISAKVDLKR